MATQQKIKDAYEAYQAKLEEMREKLFTEMVLPAVLSRAKRLKIKGLRFEQNSFTGDNVDAFYYNGHMVDPKGTPKQVDFLEFLSIELEDDAQFIHQ